MTKTHKSKHSRLCSFQC